MIDIQTFTVQLLTNAQTIAQMTVGISDEQIRWKPDPESWSILEVVCHMYDEERDDFRARLDHIWHRPNEPWPRLNVDIKVVERRYNEQDLREMLAGFLYERESSVAELRRLKDPNWDFEAPAPWGGTIRAGDMAAAWVAHDLLHIRQLTELHWAYTNQKLQPYSTLYAGVW